MSKLSMEESLEKWAREKGMDDKQREEVKRTLDTAKILVSKPLIAYLTSLVDYKMKYDKDVDREKCRELKRELAKQPISEHVGHMEISFKGDTDKLRLMIAKTNRSHDILLKTCPELTQIYQQIDKLINSLLAYYQTILQDVTLRRMIIEVLGSEATQLTLNKHDTTCYLYDPFEERLGVLCFYVDKDGKPRTFS